MKGEEKLTPIKRNTGSHALPLSDFKLEYVKWFLTLVFSVLVYLGIAELIDVFYHPDIQKALDEAHKISILPYGFAPEPKEKLLFIAGALVFTLAIGGFYFLTNKYLNKIKQKTTEAFYWTSLIISVAAILFIIYDGFIAPNPFAANPQNPHDYNAKTNFDFYFFSTFVYNYLFVSLLIIFPLVVFGFFYKYNFSTKTLEYINKAKEIFIYCFGAALILVVFFISVFKFPYTPQNKYDFNAVYYSVVQVFHGMPLLVDNFTSTYGLYPHFLMPILKITGLSVQSFSFIMACLSALCFVFIFLFLLKIVKNKVLLLLGFATLYFNCYMYPRVAINFDPYFAMCPIRWLFPCGMIIYSLYYLHSPSRRKYFVSFFLFSTGILWCPDLGSLTYVSLFFFYSFLELKRGNIKTILKGIARHFLIAAVVCCITFLAYSLIIRIIYGSFPELLKMFTTINVFSVLGFNMLPMPFEFHPWMLIVIIYLIGLLYSAYGVINRKQTSRVSIVFLLTALGIASFSYYQGRSHNWNLFVSNFEAFLLLPVFADDLLVIARKQWTFILPFSVLILFLFFSFFQIVYDCDRITSLLFEKENKANNLAEQNGINENADFIRSNTIKDERILIITADQFQALYHDLSKTCSAINPGWMDLFLRSDYERIVNYLINNKDVKIFFDPRTYHGFDGKIVTILAGLYNIEKSEENNGLMMLEKKREITDNNFILKQDKDDILHKRLDNNFINKLHYMEGEMGKVNPGDPFSVELIFKPVSVPSSAYTQWATVLCNDSADKGLRIVQSDTSQTQFYLAISNEGAACPVLLNKWNYLCFEINGKMIKSFSNGMLAHVISMQHSFINSNEPLYVGNHEQQDGFFFGDIKEVRIANGLPDEKDIKATMDKVSVLQ